MNNYFELTNSNFEDSVEDTYGTNKSWDNLSYDDKHNISSYLGIDENHLNANY